MIYSITIICYKEIFCTRFDKTEKLRYSISIRIPLIDKTTNPSHIYFHYRSINPSHYIISILKGFSQMKGGASTEICKGSSICFSNRITRAATCSILWVETRLLSVPFLFRKTSQPSKQARPGGEKEGGLHVVLTKEHNLGIQRQKIFGKDGSGDH